MDALPAVVRVALQNACDSGRTLSWKVQENAKGTLIQLHGLETDTRCLLGRRMQRQYGGL